jgi:GNAT superfamily N-acetyltransferase
MRHDCSRDNPVGRRELISRGSYTDRYNPRMGLRLPENFSIRAVSRHDYDQWRPLWDGYNAFYGRSGETALSPDITRMTWARFFDAYEPVHALVAEGEGQLLGLAHYLFHRSTIAIEPFCYLQDLFTSPAARGKGIGRALIQGVYERASLAGAPRVYWHTHKTNDTAMQLYDKVAEQSGFVVYRKIL